MTIRRAACCCEPATAPNCREFQIACFNTDKYANMPEYATINGSLTSVRTTYHFGAFPGFCRCPIRSRIREIASWSVTVRKRPLPLPGQFGGCNWLGNSLDRICWEGVGGTFKYEVYESQYALCDFRPSQPGGGCGCTVNQSDPCATPNLLEVQRETKISGSCYAFVGCSADTYLDSNGNCIVLYGHGLELSGVDCVVDYYEHIFPPFCNGCPNPFGQQQCEYRSRSTSSTQEAGFGFARGCGGNLDGSRRNCILPGGVGFDSPRSVFFDTPVGGEKINDDCGRVYKVATCECKLTFS